MPTVSNPRTVEIASCSHGLLMLFKLNGVAQQTAVYSCDGDLPTENRRLTLQLVDWVFDGVLPKVLKT